MAGLFFYSVASDLIGASSSTDNTVPGYIKNRLKRILLEADTPRRFNQGQTGREGGSLQGQTGREASPAPKKRGRPVKRGPASKT